MITLRNLLLLVGFAALQSISAQTVKDAFPDFSEQFDVTTFHVSSREQFPLHFRGIQKRPNIETWIDQLQKVPQSDDSAEVAIFRDQATIRFVRIQYSGTTAQQRIYKLSSDFIEFVTLLDGQVQLWQNQLGISCTRWLFDSEGNLLTTKYLRWNPRRESDKLVFEWILAREEKTE